MNVPPPLSSGARAIALFAASLWAGAPAPGAVVSVETVDQLVGAVNNGAAGDTVEIAAGTYRLPGTLAPKADMTIRGAGAGRTILAPDDSWRPSADGLPDNATDSGSAVAAAYLFDLGGSDGVKVRDLTADGAGRLHGAFCGNDADGLELSRLHVRDFVWCGVRTWRMDGATIERCEFEDAGGVHGGVTGGALFLTWAKASRVSHNRFRRSGGLSFRNNHVIANRTATPRTEGLFGFAPGTAFDTIVIEDNVIECIGQPRPLVRNGQSRAATVRNNTLVNVSDAGSFDNADTGAVRGPTEPLRFRCGADEEFLVDQWTVSNGTAGAR